MITWFWSISALRWYNFKAPVGFEDWFYTGPTLYFGHAKSSKRGKKRKLVKKML